MSLFTWHFTCAMLIALTAHFRFPAFAFSALMSLDDRFAALPK